MENEPTVGEQKTILAGLIVGLVLVFSSLCFCCAIPGDGTTFEERQAAREQQRAAEAQRLAERLAEYMAWQVQETRSEMDDSVGVRASRRSVDTVRDWLGREHTPVLHIRCQENKTEVFIRLGMSTEPELGHMGATVRVRLDDGSPETVRTSLSTDRQAVFFGRPITLAKRLDSADRLIIEFTPHNMGRATAAWDLTDSEEPIAAVRAACSW